MARSTSSDPVLALDGVSPVASVAVAAAGELLAVRRLEAARSSTVLLALVDETLRAAGVEPHALGGLAAAAGPGSFTGTRVTLATALGLRLGTGAPAVAVSNLEALALAAGDADIVDSADGVVLAAVDALRGAWFVQRFAAPGGRPEAREPPRRLAPEDPPERGVALLVGFGLEALAGTRTPGATRWTPEDLASPLALAASRGRWPLSRDGLLQPLYLAPPNVRRPAP